MHTSFLMLASSGTTRAAALSMKAEPCVRRVGATQSAAPHPPGAKKSRTPFHRRVSVGYQSGGAMSATGR